MRFVPFFICFKILLNIKKIHYMFLLLNRYFNKLRCAAPRVGDVGHDIVGLLDHPVVAP